MQGLGKRKGNCEMREKKNTFLYGIDKKNSTSPTYLYT